MKFLKGSRFWMITPPFVLLAALMALKFDDPSVFTNITLVWMGGAGAKTTADVIKNGRG